MWTVGTAGLYFCAVDYRVIFFILNFHLCMHLINMVAELGHWELSSVSLAWGLSLELTIFDFLTESKCILEQDYGFVFGHQKRVWRICSIWSITCSLHCSNMRKSFGFMHTKLTEFHVPKFFSFIVLVSSICTLTSLLFQLKFYPFTNSPCFSFSIAFFKLAYRSSFILISWFI